MKMGDSVPDFLEKTLTSIQNLGIEPGLVLVDREFFSVDCIRTLDKRGVTYMMPCRNTHNVIAALREFARNARTDISTVEMEGQTGSAEYWMKIEKCKDPTKPEQKYIGFATNDPRIDLKRYKNRWMINKISRDLDNEGQN